MLISLGLYAQWRCQEFVKGGFGCHWYERTLYLRGTRLASIGLTLAFAKCKDFLHTISHKNEVEGIIRYSWFATFYARFLADSLHLLPLFR